MLKASQNIWMKNRETFTIKQYYTIFTISVLLQLYEYLRSCRPVLLFVGLNLFFLHFRPVFPFLCNIYFTFKKHFFILKHILGYRQSPPSIHTFVQSYKYGIRFKYNVYNYLYIDINTSGESDVILSACWRYSLVAAQRRNLTYACELLCGIMQQSKYTFLRIITAHEC